MSQVQSSSVTTEYILSGVNSYDIVQDVIVIPADSQPGKKAVGVLTLDGTFDSVSVLAEDSKREPVTVRPKAINEFFIYAVGKVYVYATTATKEPFSVVTERFVIEIGNPDVPDDPDDPDVPTPTVPDDQFDNLGQRVAKWAAGLPKQKEVAAVYLAHVNLLLTDPSYTINSISLSLKTALYQIAEYPQYVNVIKNVQADLMQRWDRQPLNRVEFAAYYQAIAAGLGVQ